jgi:hypothetical protein
MSYQENLIYLRSQVRISDNMRNLKGNNGTNLGIGLLVILVVAVFAPTLVHAKDYTVGVKAGDWVKYGQITVTWTGNGTEPSYITDTKKLDWVRIDVLSVAGTTAILNFTYHYNNGTQTFLSLDADVQNSALAGGYLVASNLKVGDRLSPQTPETTINQTVTGLYAGANRNVNVIDYKLNSTGYPMEEKFYWDQNTGIMVELYINATDTTNSGLHEEISFKATETNMWSASALDFMQNNLIYIIAGIAIIAVIVTTAIVLRRRKAPPTQQPAPPSTSQPPPS